MGLTHCQAWGVAGSRATWAPWVGGQGHQAAVRCSALLFPGDRYDPEHVCNASDTAGYYAYSRQPEVCKWNLQKLAEALEPELPRELGQAVLAEEFDTEFQKHYLYKMRRKLGLVGTEREEDTALVATLLETMHLTGEWGGLRQPGSLVGTLVHSSY